jgi:Uma2 family endonuclease
MPALPDTAYFTMAADWICEVVSPKTGRLDRLKKLPVFARGGVAHAWLIEPLQRTLEVMRLEHSRWVIVAVHGEAGVVRAEPFEAIEVHLGLLWADGAEAAPE